MYNDIEFQQYLAKKTNIPFSQIQSLFMEEKDDVFEVAKLIIDRYKFDKDELGKIWGDYINFAYVNPKNMLTDNAFIKKAGLNFVKQKKIVPIFKLGKALTIACSDPMNPFLQDHLERVGETLVTFVFCFPFDVDDFLKNYDPYAEEKAAAKKAEEERLAMIKAREEEEAKKAKAIEEEKQRKDIADKYLEGSQSRELLLNLRKIQSKNA